MTVYIYGLWDPRDGRLRYIGKTVNPRARFYRHLVDYDRGKITHCSTWVKGILQSGNKPMMEILEEVTPETWQEIERDWIAQARTYGLDLVNMVSGGSGGRTPGTPMPEEVKQKISQKLKGRDAYWLKGKARTEAEKQAISLANKGRKPRLGMHNRPETNAKIGASNSIVLRGRKLSETEKQRCYKGAQSRWSKPGEHERAQEKNSKRPRNSKGQFVKESE